MYTKTKYTPRSRLLDLLDKINDWFQQEDGMNLYYDKNRKTNKVQRPHLQIPQPKSYERQERERQKKIIEKLANSDNLSFCSETGMARHKEHKKQHKAKKRRTPSLQRKERHQHDTCSRSSRTRRSPPKVRKQRRDPYKREEP